MKNSLCTTSDKDKQQQLSPAFFSCRQHSLSSFHLRLLFGSFELDENDEIGDGVAHDRGDCPLLDVKVPVGREGPDRLHLGEEVLQLCRLLHPPGHLGHLEGLPEGPHRRQDGQVGVARSGREDVDLPEEGHAEEQHADAVADHAEVHRDVFAEEEGAREIHEDDHVDLEAGQGEEVVAAEALFASCTSPFTLSFGKS